MAADEKVCVTRTNDYLQNFTLYNSTVSNPNDQHYTVGKRYTENMPNKTSAVKALRQHKKQKETNLCAGKNTSQKRESN